MNHTRFSQMRDYSATRWCVDVNGDFVCINYSNNLILSNVISRIYHNSFNIKVYYVYPKAYIFSIHSNFLQLWNLPLMELSQFGLNERRQ